MDAKRAESIRKWFAQAEGVLESLEEALNRADLDELAGQVSSLNLELSLVLSRFKGEVNK